MLKKSLLFILHLQINNPLGKSALDIGTGTGITAFTLAQLGFKFTGIDIS